MRFSSCRGIIIKDNQLVVMEREKMAGNIAHFLVDIPKKTKQTKNVLFASLWKNLELWLSQEN